MTEVLHLLKEMTSRISPFNGMTLFINNALCGFHEIKDQSIGDQTIDWDKKSTTPYTQMDIEKYKLCKKCVKSANKIMESNFPYKL